MPTSILHDLRHSVRALLAKPGFTIAVVLTLALGIGANTAVFSAIQGLLLKPLPYPLSEQLVYIYNAYPKMGVEYSGTTVPDYLDRRERADALADSAIYYDYSFDLADQGAPQRVAGVVATPSLFSTLNVNAQLGRTFSTDEAQTGRERVVLLSDALWRNHFGADGTIVGRDIRISGQNYRVIGVMPAWFAFPRREVQLWVPFAFSDKQKSDSMRGFEFAESIGRLKPGASSEQLAAQFDAIVAHNLERFSGAGATGAPDFRARVESTGFTGRARNLKQQLVADVSPTLWLLQAAVALVLVIACANVANLMLIRLSARQRELSMRAALGASRGRVAQQLLVDSLALAIMGGSVGIAVAFACIELIRALGLDGGARGFGIGLSVPVLGFALVSTLATGLVCTLVAVVSMWRKQSWQVLKEGSRGSLGSRSARATRNALVVVQMGLAVALLVGAGLLIHSFWRLQQQSPGFNSDNLVSASLNLSRDRYRDVAATAQFYERVVNAVRALPGVKSAGVVSGMPFSADKDTNPYFIEGQDPAVDAAAASGYYQVVDEDFFRTLEIPLLQGRGFQTSDGAGAPAVAIIDESLASKGFGKRSPIGGRIGTRNVNGQVDWHTIVGVVASVKRQRLSDNGESETYYFPYRQQPTRIFRIAIRSELAVGDLAGPLRAAVAQIDPEQPVFDVMTMHERISRSLDDRRTPMLLLMLFAGVALGLSAVGIYGVLAFAVAQRTGEIGVRMSLGARGADIARLVLIDGARLVAFGLVIGTVLALSLAHRVRAQLFGIEMVDPLTLCAVLALVAAVALLAIWIPAQRAAGTSPTEALRYE